ncbi:uncharacterized protein HMPREF1541_00419 [Cyphellophora europaea CBS 101466]|uniref:Uncharacterized protein n=1 Tax=Cyphellophora europaea (strain CBS 101466) TaxID=1220924 RepID=W2SCA2_CYPE1|nr:uncharacterized protein HMPREF1541_00419 [Cyphellophora europaea CBS 101466]ETN46235.1 hypothetical protein HMPREF1541_00419 [Cyphellophora europaea CBS 101466]
MTISATSAPNGTTAMPKHEDDPAAAPNNAIKPPAESHLLHRSFHDHPTSVTSTSNLVLTLSNGTKILDGCGGAAVSCLGYDPAYIQEISAAVTQQLASVPYVHTLSYTTPVAEELATHLLSHPDGSGRPNAHGLEKAYFIGSGSEAMDAALKFARQYWFELGRREKVHYVSRRQSYHGNTVGAMSVSFNVPRKAPYMDEGCLQVKNVSWVAPAYQYQYAMEGEGEEEYSARLVREVEEEFLRVGPERVVAFIAEPIVGATSGAMVAPRGYFKGVREVCDRYDVLLILDEVMCGMGRTGTLFAFEQEGITPDLLTMGKCLGAGFAPIAAVLVGSKVVKGLRGGSGNVAHGHTYQSHPVSCAAALAVQKILRRDNLIARSKEMGVVLEKLLKKELGNMKYVGNIRGRGLFWAVEFVQDKQTREPFAPEKTFGPRFQARVFAKGVAVYPGAGTVNGAKGDHAIVCPAYTVKEEELKAIIKVMKEVYLEMEQEVDTRQ